MSNRNEVKLQVAQLSKVTATSLVHRILKKHGISKDNIQKVSSEERAKVKKLLNDLKTQSDSLMKNL